MQINIYCINLDERKDRWDFIQSQFSKIPQIKLVRISATQHKEGWVGCGLSHIGIVEKYMTMDVYLIVIEDDCIIHDAINFYERLTNIINWLDLNNNQWDIFNGNPSYINNLSGCRLLSPEMKIIQYSEGLTANFIIYNSKKADLKNRLLQYKRNINKCVVIFKHTYIKKPKRKYIITCKNKNVIYNVNGIRYSVIYDRFINKNFCCITSIPFMTSQIDSPSDIEKKDVNYIDAIKLSETILSKLIV